VPPAGEARFAVLDEKQAGRIQAVRNGEHRSHLLLGVLYAQAGLVPEARVELRKLEVENPDSAVVKRLLAGVAGL
jgi:Flp pilus assembly protein TadD